MGKSNCLGDKTRWYHQTCVDYRRLNAVTKVDEYPLPRVDDCLDLLLYKFAVMPFGLCNVPATFQRLMNRVLKGLTTEKCMVYLDDILVMGRSFAKHLLNLREVFDRLREAHLRLKSKKCHFAKREVLYLGYVVSELGI